MRYDGKIQEFLDAFHVTNIIDEFPIMLVAVILE
jgi:hypothetical protein